MKLIILLAIFLILICIHIRRGFGLINKCKKWNNWSECKHNFIVRYCISDKSLHEAKDCENCGHWTQWSSCENGKQRRHLTKCPHIRDTRKCEKHQKHTEENNNDEIYVELAGAVINKKKIKHALKPSFIHEQYNSRRDIHTDNWNPYETKDVNEEYVNEEDVNEEDVNEEDVNVDVNEDVNEDVNKDVNEDVNEDVNKDVNEEDLTKYNGISNVQNKYETNQKSFIVKNEHKKSHSRNTSNKLSSIEEEQEQKQALNKSFINEIPHDAEAASNVQHEEDKVEAFTLQSSPQISDHKILEEIEENTAGSASTASLILNSSSNINESEAENATKLEFNNTLPEFESAATTKEILLPNSEANVFSETSVTETNATKGESKSESKESGKNRGFSASRTNIFIATGVGASIVSLGAVVAYVYSHKKKKSGEIEIDSRNENYEVIFNEDDKVDQNKILYEEEFWGYE